MPLSKQDIPTPASFENWINFASHRTTIWGVDPGINDIFVAADGANEDRHRYRKLSSKEYYHLCGFNKATEKRRRWKIEEGEQWKNFLTTCPASRQRILINFWMLCDMDSTILRQSLNLLIDSSDIDASLFPPTESSKEASTKFADASLLVPKSMADNLHLDTSMPLVIRP